jgi:hypothetical protein
LEFPKIRPTEYFSKIDPKELEDDVKWKVTNMKVVKNFKTYDLEPKLVQNGVLMLHKIPNYWRVQKQIRDSDSWWHGWLKLLPYKINLAKPLIWRLMGLSKSHHKGSRDSKRPWIQGFWSDGPGEASNTIY